jgi:NTP pyrophosphatase (non-canonical NTP hydrolase)
MDNDLVELQSLVVRFRDARNWRIFHDSPKNLAQAIAVEASELSELYLWNRQPRKDDVTDEMADVLIYLLSLADILEVELGEAVIRKIAKNEKKYPIERAYGNDRKYSEL